MALAFAALFLCFLACSQSFSIDYYDNAASEVGVPEKNGYPSNIPQLFLVAPHVYPDEQQYAMDIPQIMNAGFGLGQQGFVRRSRAPYVISFDGQKRQALLGTEPIIVTKARRNRIRCKFSPLFC